MLKKHVINKLPWALAIIGWTLYALDDTLSKLVYEVSREGLTVDRILQLSTLSAVTFLAVRVERITQLFRIFKTDIKVETSKTIGDLTSKIHSQNKDIKKMSDYVNILESHYNRSDSKITSLWQVILIFIFILTNHSTQESNDTGK